MSHEGCKLRYKCTMINTKVCDVSKADGCYHFGEKKCKVCGDSPCHCNLLEDDE